METSNWLNIKRMCLLWAGQTEQTMKRAQFYRFKTSIAQVKKIMLKLIKKIIKRKRFVIGLLALWRFVKKK